MSFFKVGEIAVFVTDGKFRGIAGSGSECELVRLAAMEDRDAEEAFRFGAIVWYCRFPGDPGPKDGLWSVPETHLRKRRPPASPFSFQEIINMCNDSSITEPERA